MKLFANELPKMEEKVVISLHGDEENPGARVYLRQDESLLGYFYINSEKVLFCPYKKLLAMIPKEML